MQQSKTRGVDRSFYRQMLALALPIALQNLLSTSANLVDTAMITRIGNLAIAASGVAGRWNFFLNMILFGFASGSSVLISQYWGVRDIKNIQKTYGIGLLLGLLVAVAYTIICFVIPEQMVSLFTTEKELIAPTVEYLQIVAIGTIPVTYSYLSGIARRATEDVRTPVVGAIVSTLTNIFFNWVLIYGNLGAPAMGLRGAAIATTLSYFAHMIFYIILGLSKKHFTFASPKILFGFSKDYFTKYIKITAPVLANETLWGIGMNIYTIIFARQGSEYYAGYTIFSSIQQMTFIFFVGVCSACSIMVGKSVGRGELEEAYALGKRFLLMVPVMGVVLGALLAMLRGPVLALMQVETEQAANVASTLLLFFSFWMGIRNISYTAVVGIIRPGGDTKMGFFMDILTVYFFAIPVVAVLAYVFKVPFIWLVIGMYLAEDTPKTFICLWYFKSKKWIRQLTQTEEEALI